LHSTWSTYIIEQGYGDRRIIGYLQEFADDAPAALESLGDAAKLLLRE